MEIVNNCVLKWYSRIVLSFVSEDNKQLFRQIEKLGEKLISAKMKCSQIYLSLYIYLYINIYIYIT